MRRYSPSRVRRENLLGHLCVLGGECVCVFSFSTHSTVKKRVLPIEHSLLRADVNIRPATPADVAGMIAIEKNAPPAAHWSPEQYAKIWANDSHRLCLIIEDQSHLQGFVVARFVGNECELENIVVARANQRRGFGSALMVEFLNEARSRKAEAIFLEVRQSNTAARRLYAKCGFVESGRRKSYYSDPVEDGILYSLAKSPNLEPASG